MAIPRFPQTWQIINESPLTVLETSTREPLDNLFNILDSKLDYPFRISLSDTVLTVNPSEVQLLESDGSGYTTNSFKIGTAPLNGVYLEFEESTVNFSTGDVNGDFLPSSAPFLTAWEYIWVGIEAFSTGFISLVWGIPSNTISGSVFPEFSSGTTAISLVLLRSAGGTWNFYPPTQENIIIFKGSGSSSSNGGAVSNSYFLEASSVSLDFGSSASGVFTWTESMYILQPYYGRYIIPSGSMSNVVDGDVLYTQIYPPQFSITDGAVSGSIGLSDISYFADDDSVIIGDANSVQVSGYVYGTPASNKIIVDDGLGNVINLSAFTRIQGAWVIKTNVIIEKDSYNSGIIKPNSAGFIPANIFIIGSCLGDSIFLTNGIEVTKNWYYEESYLTTEDIEPGDKIPLPTDSRNNFAPMCYKSGFGNLEVFLGGINLNCARIVLTYTFQPISYDNVTGILLVPDTTTVITPSGPTIVPVDLSLVKRGSTFEDGAGNIFPIYGDVINTTGAKQFLLATGLTVNLGSESVVFQRDYVELGNVGYLENLIASGLFIPMNSILKFRISSLINRTGSTTTGNTVTSKWESGWINTNAVTTFTHALNNIPSIVTMVYNNNGTYEYLDVFSYVATFDLNLIIMNWLGLALDANHSVKIYITV